MAQLLPSRQSRHACSFCRYGTFRLSQHSPCLTLGPRLRCVARPVKSFNSLLRQPCLHSLAIGNMHRECAIACACYACFDVPAIVMHAAQQQSPPGKHSCITAATCCKQSNNSRLFVLLVLGGRESQQTITAKVPYSMKSACTQPMCTKAQRDIAMKRCPHAAFLSL